MRQLLLAAGLSLLLCAAQAGAAIAPPAALPADASASLDPAEAPAGAYTLDPRHASVTWRVRHTGVGIYVARFDAIAATLNFDPQNPAASSLDAVIDANSVNTGLVNDDGERAFDREIAEVLGAESAPQIRFVSRSIELTGPASGLIEGDLTLNGQTHPATLEAQFQGGRFVQLRGKHVLAFSGRTIINRREWDAGSLIFNQFAGDEVEILIEAEFVKD
ncbi:MAG: YceI family protein [Hyphomonadaceae bacterium]